MIYKEKILIVHRNSLVEEKIAQYLRENGFAVIMANNPENSLALVKSMKPDLILWGEVLTAHSKEIMKKIKKSRYGTITPIIAMLPDIELFDRLEIEKTGIDDIIDLIPNFTDLKIKIRFHLQNKRRLQSYQQEIFRLRDMYDLQNNLIRMNDVNKLCELVNDHILYEYHPETLISLVYNKRSAEFDYKRAIIADHDMDDKQEEFFNTPFWKRVFFTSSRLESKRIADSYLIDFFNTLDIKSDTFYQFPMQVPKNQVGIIILGFHGNSELSEEDVRNLDTLADSLAFRIVQLRQVFGGKQKPPDDPSRIHFLFERLDEDEISDYLSQQLKQLLQADAVIYFNYNEGFRFLYPQYCYTSSLNQNLFENEKPPVLMLKDFPTFEKYIEAKKNHAYYNLTKTPADDLARITSLAKGKYPSLLVFTVHTGNEIKGFYVLANERTMRRFTSKEIEEAERLINRATSILAESRVVRHAQKTIKQLDRVFELGKELTIEIDIDELLKKIARAVRRTLGWNVIILDKKNPMNERYENVAILGIKQKEYNELEKTRLPARFRSLKPFCFKISNSYFWDHTLKDEAPDSLDQKRFLASIGKEWDDDDWLLVPILSKGRELGYLAVNDPVDRVRPNVEKVRSIEYFANQAALALENAALYENLKSSEEKYRLLAETIVMGLVNCDLSGKILYANKSLVRLLEYTRPSSLVGQSLFELCSPKTRAEIEDNVLQLIKNSEVADGQGIDIELLSNNNEYLPFKLYITPYNQKSKKAGFIGVLADMRPQHRLERMKNEFNSMIVHDLRSPLNIIQGYIDIVRGEIVGQISGEQDELLGIAKENVDKVLRLIDNFMIASKIEAGKFDINLEIHSINALIESVYKHHIPLAKNKNIELELKLDQNIVLQQFDKLRIEQVLNNYISNALKFTDEGGKIVIFSKMVKEKNALTHEEIMAVHVGVQDTGVGIPYEEQEKVFSKYEQTEAGKDAALKGTGLGLAICKEIVSLHNGRVWLESEPGKGSTFYFSLPIIPIKI